MKNFVFPQIFQPVLQRSYLNDFNWPISSRRVQTQIQLLNSKCHDHHHLYNHYVKLSDKRLILHPAHANQSEKKDKKVGKRISSDLSLTTLNRGIDNGGSCLDEGIKIEKEREDHQQKKTLEERGLNRYVQGKIIQSFDRRSQNEIKITQLQNIFQNRDEQNGVKQVKKKTEKTIKRLGVEGYENSDHRKQNKAKQDSKIKKSSNKGIKNSNKANQQVQKQKDGKSHHSKVAFPPKKVVGPQSERSNSNKKESKNIYKKEVRKDRRRVGVEKKEKIDVQFEKSSEVNQIMLKNQFYNSSATLNLYPSLLSTNKTKLYGIQHQMQTNNGRVLRMQTFHAILGSDSEIRQHHHKRSYSIWDIVNSSQSQQEIQERGRKEPMRFSLKKQKEAKQKILKKVHFGRTSIEQMAGQSKKEIKNSITILNSHKSMRHKGVPKRSEEREGMDQIQSQKQVKVARNLVTKTPQVIKSSRLKNNSAQNVYNDLNYLRMKLNFLKNDEDKPEDKRQHPKPLITHIEKVIYTKQIERQANNTKLNQMIDFAIFLGRDKIIKQVDLYQKGNFFKK